MTASEAIERVLAMIVVGTPRWLRVLLAITVYIPGGRWYDRLERYQYDRAVRLYRQRAAARIGG